MDDIKLAISLSIPKEREYKQDLIEKVKDCMEQVEYGSSPEAYHYLRCLNAKCVELHRCGKRSDKLHTLLGLLTPFLAKHGLEDWRGVELIEEYTTNSDYEADNNE